MIKEILTKDDPVELKSLFSFDSSNTDEQVIAKFNLWGRKLFPQYFKSKDAPFHHQINLDNLRVYREGIQFIDIAFRGAGKDVKTKLFIAFVIVNDMDHFRRYFKVLSEDGGNSKQSVTDIYNMLITPRVSRIYPETFEKTIFKREETMGGFTTATGIKVVADTVGTEQRGAIQEETRPDFIWFNDFETRKTLRSAVITRAIWDNMEEARTGLEKGAGGVYTCNYISELGNVHRLVTESLSERKVVLILPIADEEGNPTWDRYTKEDIQIMKETDDDFEGERMCRPSASRDVLFDRERLEGMTVRQPIKESAGFKIYREFNPSHRYGSGHDVAGGVSLDSSTSVFIDFDVFPNEVVGVFASNTIKPEAFGDEIFRQTELFGGNIAAIENNKFDQAVLKAKQLGTRLYSYITGKDIKFNKGTARDYGWSTNSATKPKMFFDFAKAVQDGLLVLNDKDLIAEAKSYSRNELMDREADARLTTRHFDLLTAGAIAWQMRNHATIENKSDVLDIYIEELPMYPDIGV